MSDPLWTVDATLKAKGFTLARPPAVYRGPISVHGNPAIVEIHIPDFTFVTMPEVTLVDDSKLPVKNLAHLIGDGGICYLGEGGLPLDLYDPGGSVLRVLREAEVALERSFGGGATAEYEAELGSYWRGQTVLVVLPFSDIARVGRADMIDLGTAEKARFVVVPEGGWKHLKPRFRGAVTVLWYASNLRHTEAFRSKTLGGILTWLAAQRETPKGWREAVIASASKLGATLVVAPNAIIGWEPEFPKGLAILNNVAGFRPGFFQKQMMKSLDKVGLIKMSGIQTDLQFVVERNLGPAPSLRGKKIMLVGCGTIGSSLAKLLVQCGAGCEADFTIYDTDILRPGNLGRHLLGFDDLNRPKAGATAEYLRRFHPDVRIKPIQQDALKDWSALERADLVIDATGDYNVATALNALRMKSLRTGKELAILHTWVFGNGVAVQSFLNLKDEFGCYRCLKPEFDGLWRYSPLRDAKRQVELAVARCGEAGYIPFAVDAPVAAASLALRAVLDWAAGYPGQRLRTVTLDHQEGREVKWASPSRHAECPACGG